MPPHSKSTTGLTDLTPGKNKITLTIETEGRTLLTMIKDVLIVKPTDMRLRIRKDKTIKNIQEEEFDKQMRELDFFEVKEEDKEKYEKLGPRNRGMSLGALAGAGLGALDSAGDMFGKGKGLLGDAKGLMGDAKGLMGDAKGIMGDAKGMVGDARGMVGNAKGAMNSMGNIMDKSRGMIDEADELLDKGKGIYNSSKKTAGKTKDLIDSFA